MTLRVYHKTDKVNIIHVHNSLVAHSLKNNINRIRYSFYYSNRLSINYKYFSDAMVYIHIWTDINVCVNSILSMLFIDSHIKFNKKKNKKKHIIKIYYFIYLYFLLHPYKCIRIKFSFTIPFLPFAVQIASR